jgi:hypothetical protein
MLEGLGHEIARPLYGKIAQAILEHTDRRLP